MTQTDKTAKQTERKYNTHRTNVTVKQTTNKNEKKQTEREDTDEQTINKNKTKIGDRDRSNSQTDRQEGRPRHSKSNRQTDRQQTSMTQL